MVQSRVQTVDVPTLIGTTANMVQPSASSAVEYPASSGIFYSRGRQLVFNSQTGQFDLGGGSTANWALVSIASVTVTARRESGSDVDESPGGFHVNGPTDTEAAANSSTVTWGYGSAVGHVWDWEYSSGLFREVQTIGYATRAEVEDGVGGDGVGLEFSDGVQTVGWEASPPVPDASIVISAFGAPAFLGALQPLFDEVSFVIDYEREAIRRPRRGPGIMR